MCTDLSKCASFLVPTSCTLPSSHTNGTRRSNARTTGYLSGRACARPPVPAAGGQRPTRRWRAMSRGDRPRRPNCDHLSHSRSAGRAMAVLGSPICAARGPAELRPSRSAQQPPQPRRAGHRLPHPVAVPPNVDLRASRLRAICLRRAAGRQMCQRCRGCGYMRM